MEWLLDIVLIILLAISLLFNAYLFGKKTNVHANNEEKPALSAEEIERERQKQFQAEKKIKYFNNFMSYDGTPQIP